MDKDQTGGLDPAFCDALSGSVSGRSAGGKPALEKEDFREYLSLYAILEQNKSTWQDMKNMFCFCCVRKGFLQRSASSPVWLAQVKSWRFCLHCGWDFGGVLATVFLLQAGLEGFLFCMAGILSQLLFYIPAVILFLLIMGKQRRMIPGGAMSQWKSETCFVSV